MNRSLDTEACSFSVFANTACPDPGRIYSRRNTQRSKVMLSAHEAIGETSSRSIEGPSSFQSTERSGPRSTSDGCFIQNLSFERGAPSRPERAVPGFTTPRVSDQWLYLQLPRKEWALSPPSGSKRWVCNGRIEARAAQDSCAPAG